jgi:hypothetical protein
MKIFHWCILALSVTMPWFVSSAAGDNVRKQGVSPMERYLAMSCPDDALYKPLVRELKANATAAEAYFINLIEHGPDAGLIDLERMYAQRQFARRQAFLQKDTRNIVRDGFKQVQDSPHESEEIYIERKLHAFRIRLTYRAMEGLKLLDSVTGRAFLLRKAGDQQFPLHQIAEELVESF